MNNPDLQKPDETNFRDRLATIDDKGKRVWVYAKKPSGKLTTARNYVGFILLAFFLIVPFIKVNGEQFLLLDVIHRKFVIFGVQFWPQDFHLFFLAMISTIVFIILFTVAYGRIWCGWACPQTVFMELVFRRIEYWIEGDASAQKELNTKPWNGEKIFKRGLKHGIFYLISFIIGNYFLMYIISSDELLRIITESPSKHIAGLSGMIVFSFIFYFIFSWFREQVCTIVCPYGRLQGVLLDRNSIVISYDYQRGETRGPIRKDEQRDAAGKGDCIDCKQCVVVCPTGIDIRNGTQLECINCACCIDACNTVMKRVGFKPGLIRYASEKMIAERSKIKFNARIIAYSSVLLVLLTATTYFMLARTSIEATVLRTPGMLFQDLGNGKYSNLYDIKLVNKTNADIPVELKLLNGSGEIQIIGKPVNVPKQSLGEAAFFVIVDKSQIPSSKTEFQLGVFSGGKQVDKTKITFFGPNK